MNIFCNNNVHKSENIDMSFKVINRTDLKMADENTEIDITFSANIHEQMSEISKLRAMHELKLKESANGEEKTHEIQEMDVKEGIDDDETLSTSSLDDMDEANISQCLGVANGTIVLDAELDTELDAEPDTVHNTSIDKGTDLEEFTINPVGPENEQVEVNGMNGRSTPNNYTLNPGKLDNEQVGVNGMNGHSTPQVEICMCGGFRLPEKPGKIIVPLHIINNTQRERVQLRPVVTSALTVPVMMKPQMPRMINSMARQYVPPVVYYAPIRQMGTPSVPVYAGHNSYH